tara:strand:+ start:347 stop:946 length:600 start_codon:yes stop_codon:yes gene_type:complete
MSVGIDEAGRGCLYGPVFAAAVYVENPIEDPIPPITIKTWDSKKLSEKKRDILFEYIHNYASCVKVKMIDSKTIDEINILNSTMKAMHGAIDQIDGHIEHLYVDGNQFFEYKRDNAFIPYTCIPKGDDINHLIGMASIIAKVSRDRYIAEECKNNPLLYDYEIDRNKGYGTKAHIDAIKNNGPLVNHRKTFNKVKEFVN